MPVRNSPVHISVSALLLSAASAALGQAAQTTRAPLMDALEACRSIQADAQRLACFDGAAQRLVAARAGGQIAIVEREQIRQARRSLFGFSVPDLPFLGGKRDRQADEDVPKELVSTLASFSSLGNGRYRFVIAEGNAQWETTESAPLNDPKRGDRVTIQRGALGSFFAQIGRQRWVRARRVR